jgi:hypothetical protein
MTKYKLIAIDVDGTLVGKDLIIPAHNRMAIEKAVAKGIKVVLCSGRSYASLRAFAHQLNLNGGDDHVISFNGCAIHNSSNDKLIHSFKLPRKTAVDILEKIKPFDVEAVIYWDIYGIYAYNNRRFVDYYLKSCGAEPTFITDTAQITHPDVYKIIAFHEHDILRGVESHFSQILGKDYAMLFTNRHLFEFFNPNAGKGNALKQLCLLHNIDIKDAIAIGDSENDISMIQSAGLGVAMQNAEETVKASADLLTPTVSEIIENYVL